MTSNQDRHTKAQKNLRLSPECRRLLSLLSNMDGIGESAVVELIVRKEARARGLLDATWGKRPEPRAS